MRRVLLLVCFLGQALLQVSAHAHELRPAYLDLREVAPDEFSILWKVPARGDLRLGLYLQLPSTCEPSAEPAKSIDGSAYLERWIANCAGGLKGKTITIAGLRSSATDGLARIQYLDGAVEVARLTPQEPAFVVMGARTGWAVAWTYLRLGVDHILAGYDHLLFVFALILLIPNRRMLVKTVTAFTLAHSLTLASASLGYFSLPPAPVEATIALSIAFVARELTQMNPGGQRLSQTCPWIVAFSFGLLHGFGFAGALKETGLPQSDVPLALLSFNLGVEAGQLLFIAAVLAVFAILRRMLVAPPALARPAAAYAIGTISIIWLIDRIGGFGLPISP